ncbi:tRNA (guanosine(18)-2'-O)-methyltransferase [[Candida] railenensis]|uniref:tRNA (Guanosine(18)-2'-O)-methyltransferase n=1 Tax=[Candida] railenensis TaxID=45579 RepID=A0A9P0QSD8_9ASCO|nr:tRNA (guanosine(18)-2'-O)-methyltransferase [[Candida] railenensis]
MSSISLLASYLDPQRKSELAQKLASELDSCSSLSLLCDLLPSLDDASKDAIYPTVFQFCSTSTDYEVISRLSSGLPRLNKDLFERATFTLKNFLQATKVNYLPEFKKLIIEKVSHQQDGLVNIDSDSIVSTLEFFEYMFMNKHDGIDSELDYCLVLLLGYSDEEVSSKVSSMLRWRINQDSSETYLDTNFLWKSIFALEKSDLKVHKSHSYVLWLRLITSPSKTIVNTTDHYWECIQTGLTSPSHEHRKFCLSILQVSIKSISNSATSFQNSVMSWESSKADHYLKEWSRYVTLFEILAIDTSLHQAEAGTKDIISLISPESLIHSSWGWCLLCTGFSASMDSVRKFALSLLLSIPASNLYLITTGLQFLTNVFLPNAMLASHFHVRKIGCTNEYNCEYGERLQNFVYNIVSSGDKISDSDLVLAVNAILITLNTAECFDPAKIYVSLGLLQGLKQNKILKFDNEITLKNLLILSEYRPEGELFETALQTITLRLLLSFKLQDKGDLTKFFSALHKYVKFNGTRIVNENMDLVLQLLLTNDVKKEDLRSLYEESEIHIQALIFGITASTGYSKGIISSPSINSLHLIAIILQQDLHNDKLQINYDDFASRICDRVDFTDKVEELSFYQTVASIKDQKWNDFALSTTKTTDSTANLWKIISDEVQSNDQFTLINVSKKLKFISSINNCTDHRLKFTIEELLSFNSILFKNSREISKISTTFYKVREEAFAQLYKMMARLVSEDPIEEIAVVRVVEVVDCNSSNPELNFAVSQLLFNIINYQQLSVTTLELVASKLFELWDTLNSARLFLNQKDLHCHLISTMYHEKLLRESATNESIGSILLKFGSEVLDNACGRRSILPTLTKQISDFQLSNGKDFETCYWIPELLVRGYIIQQLTSNVFRLENIIGKLYDEQVSTTGDSRIYFKIYNLEEISARINIMAILGTCVSSEFSRRIIDFVFENEEEFHLLNVIKRTDGFEEWRRIQLMSIVLIANRNVTTDYMIENYLTTFIGLLETDPSPLVRIYLEWMIASYLSESEEQTRKTFDYLKKLVDMNGGKPTLLTSYERILCMMISQQEPLERQVNLLTEFLTIVVPAATSNKAMTRHFSLSLICSIYPQIVQKKLNLDPNIFKVVENMYQTAILSESYDQHRSGDATLWDIVKDMTLVSISGGVLLRVSDRDIDFITRESYVQNLTSDQQSALQVKIGENFEELWIKDRKLQGDKKVIQNREEKEDGKGNKVTPLQTKSGALNSIVDVDNEKINVVRSDLIVVSSLVDKPPNLGGICRLSDVLGAGLLTLHDLNVKNHSQFKTVAVTADRWMPMIEVKPEDIISYFHEKKREGYTLIGLEQTDKSVELNSELKFPKKSLILLGREKEGIPGDLLAELDFCVEIKQVGVIRSMNIQTATAIIVHAYSTQHC